MSERQRLYLDHAATTPVLPEARASVAAALDSWANPSSPHGDGRRVRAALEEARRSIAELLNWPHDVILTSGASEAIQIAASRTYPTRKIVGPTEHDVVVAAMGPAALELKVHETGIVDLGHLAEQLSAGAALVALQFVNNETGVIQPLREVQKLVDEAEGVLLADCAQAAGKLPLPNADFVAISGHKFGAPPGVGALLVKDLQKLQPSGGQERGYRRGTENWPAVAGMAAALEARAFLEAYPRLEHLRQLLEREITASGGLVIGANAPRIATIGAYAMPGVLSASQLVQLDLAGISVSAGSACSSGSMKPSRVLAAMGVPASLAACTIRVSFGPSTSESDIDRFLDQWRSIATRAKAAAA